MKKSVEFEVLTVKSVDAFVAMSYPKNGLYLITDEYSNSAFINVTSGGVFGSFMDVGFYPETKDVEEDLTVEKESVNSDSVNADTLLKALAIAQNPELAKDLIK